MPFTPYHFGPSGFLGLIFRRWLDIPVFVLANVIVDLEVLAINFLGLGWPIHRYFHTLLIGAAVGVIWGLIAYPLRGLFKKVMRLFRLPYETSFLKMVISGVLGVWLHVLIDGVYHWDVRIFWPSKVRPLWRLLNQHQVRVVCVGFFIAAIVVYIPAVRAYLKNNKHQLPKSPT